MKNGACLNFSSQIIKGFLKITKCPCQKTLFLSGRVSLWEVVNSLYLYIKFRGPQRVLHYIQLFTHSHIHSHAAGGELRY